MKCFRWICGWFFVTTLSAGAAGTLAQFHTTFGNIQVELYDQDKPATVQNFIHYVQSGLYTNEFSHRLLPGFVLQAGGFVITNRGTTNWSEVPLATYTGWNFRSPENGAPTEIVPLTGSFIPFAPTKAERLKNGDPRLSIEERYPSRAAYLAKVRAAAVKLVKERYLLAQDVDPILAHAGMVWDRLAAKS